jgi:hypothetical protein
VYFAIPLDYFSDQPSTPTSQDHRFNPKLIIGLSAVVALTVSAGVLLFAGTQGLINQACYGEENCFVIDDPAISQELASRDIAGGLMTNVEMNLVYEHLNQFVLTEDGDVNPGLIAFLAAAGYIDNQQYYVERMLYHQDPSGIPNDIFKLQEMNPDHRQYLLYQGDKYLVYKLGPGRFKYEVYAERSYILTIDLGINGFYWNDVKFTPITQTYQQMLSSDGSNPQPTVIAYENFSLLEKLQTDRVEEANQPASYTNGQLAFYDHQIKKTYTMSISANWSSLFGYELMIIMQDRRGLENVREFRISLLENFDGTYASFPNFLDDVNHFELLDNGSMESNLKSLFDEAMAPYFTAVGNRPLSIFLNINNQNIGSNPYFVSQ